MNALAPDWDDLVARFGPLGFACDAPREALEHAAQEGRLFRLVADRDGFGSGDVRIDPLRAVPSSVGRGTHHSVLWECYYFTGPGVIEDLPSAVRYAWEGFGDVPGLPKDEGRVARPELARLHSLFADPEPPPWAFEFAARDPDAYLRMYIAVHPSAPPSALATMARDPDEDVRLARRWGNGVTG